MATSQMNDVIQHLRAAVLLRDGEGMTDGQLLQCFLAHRDEAAFAALVRRNGPMVWGVCRRVLANLHDAEDAFQATFLVLVRKGASVVPREMVANWLYGVAHQTALKARAMAAKRKGRERQVTQMPEPAVTEQALWRDLQPLLDQELSRLPDKYRAVLVLCDLEGRTRKEAAVHLAVPEGTVAGWLARARTMLSRRLTRHKLMLSGAALAALLSQNAASACVPPSVMTSTIKAGGLLASGPATAGGVISAPVADLTDGVLKAMLLTKLKVTTAFLVAIGLVVLGGGALVHVSRADTPVTAVVSEQPDTFLVDDPKPTDEKPSQRKEQPTAPVIVRGKHETVDADRNTVTVSNFSRRDAQKTEKTYPLAANVKVLRDGKEAKLTDLKKGVQIALTMSADQKSVVSISMTNSTIAVPVKSVEADKNTITFSVETRQGKQDKTYQVSKDARVIVEGKEIKLADLKAGTVVVLTLSVEDTNTVVQVRTPSRRGGEENE